MTSMLETASLHHYYFYNKTTQAPMPLNIMLLSHPVETLVTHQFCKNTRLWLPNQLSKILNALVLEPCTIIYKHLHSKLSKEATLCIMLRQ